MYEGTRPAISAKALPKTLLYPYEKQNGKQIVLRFIFYSFLGVRKDARYTRPEADRGEGGYFPRKRSVGVLGTVDDVFAEALGKFTFLSLSKKTAEAVF